MSFLRYKYFLAVAEEMSFQKAAQRLFISQQALSIHIQKLEEEYRVELFERKPKLRLTIAGEHMVLHCRKLMEDEYALATDLSALYRNATDKLTVGISHVRSRVFIPPIWKLFHERCPQTALSIQDTTNIQMISRLLQNEIDLFVGVNTSNLGSFSYIPLVQEPLCCVTTRSLLEQYGIRDVDKLLEEAKSHFNLVAFLKQADFPYVMMVPENRLRANLNHLLYENDIIPRIVFECNSQTVSWGMCRNSVGIGFFSPSILFDRQFYDSYDPDLCIFPITEPSQISRIDIVYHTNRKQSDAAKIFIDCTKEVFAEYADMLQGTR